MNSSVISVISPHSTGMKSLKAEPSDARHAVIEDAKMADDRLTLESSLADLPKPEWLDAIADLCAEDGFFARLGERHYAALIEEKPTLLVTFETIQGMRALSTRAQPFGWSMLRDYGWSSLCIASDGDTWFRDAPVYAFVDRLVDDGFFDEFETVVFYGAGPCAYAAAAYSVASPGSRVVAIQPQATLDPRVTEWDDRFADMRRTDFTSRYGFAPDMLDGAEKAYVIYDPNEQLDAMHAALFTRPNVQKFRTPYLGSAIQSDLIELQVLKKILLQAADDTLDTLSFAQLMRIRREYPPYLRGLMAALDAKERYGLTRMLARNVTGRMNAPRFARRLAQLENVQDG